MIARKFIINNKTGIHLRVASQIAGISKDFESKIKICKDCKEANGCSIFDILLLEAVKGSEIEVFICGKDEERALCALSEFFENGSGI